MGQVNDNANALAQAEYDARIAHYKTLNGAFPDAVIEALVYQELSQSGKVNLTGIPLDRVGIRTRVVGARLLTPDYDYIA